MAERSPPRHRHDGASPLPLGMDASPAPSRWDGAQTVWPHNPRTGWSYCVFIPSWVVLPEAKAADGAFINPTVYFRMQVGIQSPDGISTLRETLRRFSDFLHLFSALKRVFPKKQLPAAPSKHALMRINSSHSLLQERRRALEDWMVRLLANIDISRSAPMASFLELEAAARSAVNSISEGQPQASAPVIVGLPPTDATQSQLGRSPYAVLSWTGGGSSVASGRFSNLEFGSDATNETRSIGTPSKVSEGGLEVEMEALAIDQQAAIIDATATDRVQSIPQASTLNDAEEAGLGAQEQSEFSGGDFQVANDPAEISAQVAELPPVGTANGGGRAGVSLGTPRFKIPLVTMGSEKVEPQHRRRPSHDSIVSETSSAQGSELLRAASIDGALEGSLWDLPGVESGAEGVSTTGTESESLKGVGVLLPVDQRGKVRRVLVTLQRRLAVVKADMEDMLARLNQETAVKEFLATKVRDLEGELDGMRRKSQEMLQQAVSLERERVTSLQWELEECRATLLTAEETAQSNQDSRVELEQRLQEAETARKQAEKEAAEMREQLQVVQQQHDAADAQARADLKVLAKEFRSLRNAQPQLKQDAARSLEAKAALEAKLREEMQKQEVTKVSRAKFLHELAALRQRLRECSVDFLAKEEDRDASNKGALSDAFDLLTTSDNRLGFLLAEAQLLAEEDEAVSKVQPSTNGQLSNGQIHSDTDTSLQNGEGLSGTSLVDGGSEAALRKMVTDVFIDLAQLRKAMNSLTRSALRSAHQREKNSEAEPVQRKSVLNRFL